MMTRTTGRAQAQATAREAGAVRAFLPLRPADMQILLTLGSGPLHAYGLSKESAGEGQLELGIGSLYRTLNRLRTQGLIEELPEHDAERPGPARRPWRITALGRAVASAEARRLEAVIAAARAKRFLPDSER
jgi:DNA-binding PadR family transcriptional regulator